MQTKAQQADDLIETLAVKSNLSIQALTECRIGNFRKAMSNAGLSLEERDEMTAARGVLKTRDNKLSKLAAEHFPPLSVAASTPKLTKKQVFFKGYEFKFFCCIYFSGSYKSNSPICPFCCMIYAFYDLETAAS